MVTRDAGYWREYRRRRRTEGDPVGHSRNLLRHPTSETQDAAPAPAYTPQDAAGYAADTPQPSMKRRHVVVRAAQVPELRMDDDSEEDESEDSEPKEAEAGDDGPLML